MTSVALDRSSLSLSDLVIDDDTTATYVLLKDGLGRPGITWRLGAMPDSADVHGTEYVSAVKEQTSLPLRVMVQAASSAALDVAVTALEDALSQFTYPVTVDVDGVARVWSGAPAAWSTESGVQHAYVAGFFDVLLVTIPVYPVPGEVES